MNLVLVPLSSAAARTPHLYKGGQVVGSCIQLKPVANSNQRWECGAVVKAGEGFADTEGTPWKAYYCPACANALGASVTP